MDYAMVIIHGPEKVKPPSSNISTALLRRFYRLLRNEEGVSLDHRCLGESEMLEAVTKKV